MKNDPFYAVIFFVIKSVIKDAMSCFEKALTSNYNDSSFCVDIFHNNLLSRSMVY